MNSCILRSSVFIYGFFFIIELSGAIYTQNLSMLADSCVMFIDIGSYTLNYHHTINNIPNDYTSVKFSIVSLGAVACAIALKGIYILATEDSESFSEGSQVILISIGSLNLFTDTVLRWVWWKFGEGSLNAETAITHVSADLLRSIVVISVGISDKEIVDTMGGLLICLFMFYSSFNLYRKFKIESAEYAELLEISDPI